jgi:hypothetical protein
MQRPDFIQGAKLHVRTLVFHNRLLFSSLLPKKPVWFSKNRLGFFCRDLTSPGKEHISFL